MFPKVFCSTEKVGYALAVVFKPASHRGKPGGEALRGTPPAACWDLFQRAAPVTRQPKTDTEVPSTGGVIQDGQYDITKAGGPYAGGTYRVEFTAFGAEKTYSPHVSGAGPQVK